MKIQALETDITKIETDVMVAFAWQEQEKLVLSDEAHKLSTALGDNFLKLSQLEDFEGKPAQLLYLHAAGKVPADRVLLVGLGSLQSLEVADLQTAVAAAGRKAKELGAKKVAVALPEELIQQFSPEIVSGAMTEGLFLGTYVFLKHKNILEQKKNRLLEEVTIVTSRARLSAVSNGVAYGQIVSEAVSFSRDLINEPPSVTTPRYLSQIATKLSRDNRGITVEIIGPAEMEALGMGALLGIARGSDEEPRFIKLDYNGSGKPTIALVGKGITFDTGGLSLKPSEHMETMKLDMSGGAAVLGVFAALPKLKPKAHVVGLIASTENMPSGRAIKPGDIVRAMNGKTIEVLNTDAEGRVVLADAFSFAVSKIKPQIMIDLATLTGACMVALGEDIAGIFANDATLATKLKQSAQKSGERLWELPLAKEYKEQLKSVVADVKNISGSRYGGAITGALFLEEFVPKGVKWAHLDIAGPAFAEKDAPLTPRGGTGFGVRLILRFLQDLT